MVRQLDILTLYAIINEEFYECGRTRCADADIQVDSFGLFLYQQIQNRIEIKQFADLKVLIDEEINGDLIFDENMCIQNEFGVFELKFDEIDEMKKNAKIKFADNNELWNSVNWVKW